MIEYAALAYKIAHYSRSRKLIDAYDRRLSAINVNNKPVKRI